MAVSLPNHGCIHMDAFWYLRWGLPRQPDRFRGPVAFEMDTGPNDIKGHICILFAVQPNPTLQPHPSPVIMFKRHDRIRIAPGFWLLEGKTLAVNFGTPAFPDFWFFRCSIKYTIFAQTHNQATALALKWAQKTGIAIFAIPSNNIQRPFVVFSGFIERLYLLYPYGFGAFMARNPPHTHR